MPRKQYFAAADLGPKRPSPRHLALRFELVALLAWRWKPRTSQAHKAAAAPGMGGHVKKKGTQSKKS